MAARDSWTSCRRCSMGQPSPVTVADPLGRPVPAAILLVDTGGRRTAYVESHRPAVCICSRRPSATPWLPAPSASGSSLEAAVAQGATRVVVGLGGSGTNDGGAGMLAALGAGDPDALAGGGAQAEGPGRRRPPWTDPGPRAPARRSSWSSPPTSTRPCSDFMARARSSARRRAPRPRWPRSSSPRWGVWRRWYARLLPQAGTCSPARRCDSTVSRAPGRLAGWATGCSCSAAGG